MALKPSTRERLRSAGASAVAAALSRRGMADRRIDDLRPLTDSQDALVGEACLTLEHCRAGMVLVVDAGKPVPPLVALARRGIAGIVSAVPLREHAEIVRHGLPAYQRPAGAAEPLAIAGGEVLLGDRQGVVTIPLYLADEIADEADEALAFEEFTAEQVNQGGGVYGLHIPSGDRARIAFAAWRRLKGR